MYMMPVPVKHNIKSLIERITGLTVSRKRNDFDLIRSALIRNLQPDLAIDCGANAGQWGSGIKREFPGLRLISFEPLINSFEILEKKSRTHKDWEVHKVALSSYTGTSIMHFASNEGMSSSLNTPVLHSIVHPEIVFKESMEISVSTLDDYHLAGNRMFLKMDVQGHESELLKGATESIDSVAMIEVESSFTPLYESEVSHHELVTKLSAMGFIPYTFGNVHRDVKGRVWQLDTLLVRSEYM